MALDRVQLAEFCRRHHIRWPALLGSVPGPDLGPDSDVDVLVRFEADRVPRLFDLVRMEDELTAIIGRKADLRIPEDLSRYFRERVLSEAPVQYDVPA